MEGLAKSNMDSGCQLCISKLISHPREEIANYSKSECDVWYINIFPSWQGYPQIFTEDCACVKKVILRIVNEEVVLLLLG